MSDRWYFDTMKRIQWSGKIFQKIYVVLTSCHGMIGGEEQGKEDSNFYKLFWIFLIGCVVGYVLPLHHSLRNGDRAIRTLARNKPPTCFQDKSLKPLEYISKYMSIEIHIDKRQ